MNRTPERDRTGFQREAAMAAPERSTPAGNWTGAWIIALVLSVAGVAVWEGVVRSWDYAPTLNDTADLWSENRARLHAGPEDAVVVVGASRILFDLNLDVAEEALGRRPVQLAMQGTKPLALLEHLAADEQFAGTVLAGVTPGLWFVPQGPPVESADQAVRRYENWSPAQKTGHRVGVVLQETFAFINQEDLTLEALLHRIPLEDRPAAVPNQPPVFPPYFAGLSRDRQATMWDECDFGTPLALRVQQIWIPLFTPPPPPPHLTEEEFMAGFMESVQADLDRTAAAVDAIRSRGGRVVFVRCPSTDTLRDMERKFSPREGFFDRITAVTGAPFVHFEDHESLRGFSCPEWSHLTAEDAVRFTRELMPLVAEALAGE